jgi:hypothetical protein
VQSIGEDVTITVAEVVRSIRGTVSYSALRRTTVQGRTSDKGDTSTGPSRHSAKDDYQPNESMQQASTYSLPLATPPSRRVPGTGPQRNTPRPKHPQSIRGAPRFASMLSAWES